jgi:hypothetical protein
MGNGCRSINKKEYDLFFELREYQIKDGQLARWIQFMDEVLIPFQVSKGMIVLGSWSIEAENKYIWIRRFENEEERIALYAAAYKNDTWEKELLPLVNEMLDRDASLNVRQMVPSPRSMIR